MDKITNSFIEEFSTSFGYKEKPLMRQYELFANYCIVAKHMANATFSNSLQDVVDSPTYTDILFDGFAILLNGNIVSNQQEVDDIIESNTNVKVEFIAIETKAKIEDTKTANALTERIKKAFEQITEDKSIDDYADDSEVNLLQYIFTKSTSFCASVPPALYVYLVADQVAQNDAEACEKALSELNQIFCNKNAFSKIYTQVWSNQKLLDAYKKTKYSETIEIKLLETPMSFPKIEGAGDSYLAIVPFSEFKKLIIDENGMLKNSVFHDNIRAFQGDRPANIEMKKSLTKGAINEFIYKHNGVTVIASNVSYGSKELRFTDYQIVNGCQTCHVLYNNQSVPGIDELQLIVKAIGSKDKRLRNDVIMGTNSQTEVKREQLMALSEVQERIEDFYNSTKDYERLYYERRSKQYISENKVPQSKVITIPIEIYSFVSMFLGEPHNVTGYYSQVVDNVERSGKRVFSMDYMPDVYYTAGLAHYFVTRFLKESDIPSSYNCFKFHLMYAFRLLATDNVPMPNMTTPEIESYCKRVNEALSDKITRNELFCKAYDLVKRSLGHAPRRNDNMNKELTATLELNIKLLYSDINTDRQQNINIRERVESGESSYLRTYGLIQAVDSIVSLVDNSSSHICIHAGNLYSNEMNDEAVITSIRKFLNKGGSLSLLIYNYDETRIKSSPLFQMLAYMQSVSKRVVIKRTEDRSTLKVSGERMIFNLFLFDSKSERLELQDAFTNGRLWLNQPHTVSNYQEFYNKNFDSENATEVSLTELFNLNGL